MGPTDIIQGEKVVGLIYVPPFDGANGSKAVASRKGGYDEHWILFSSYRRDGTTTTLVPGTGKFASVDEFLAYARGKCGSGCTYVKVRATEAAFP